MVPLRPPTRLSFPRASTCEENAQPPIVTARHVERRLLVLAPPPPCPTADGSPISAGRALLGCAAAAAAAEFASGELDARLPISAGSPDASATARAAVATALLKEHMGVLLSELHRRLKAKYGNHDDVRKALASMGGGEQATRELRLLTKLSEHLTDGEQARAHT